MCNALAWRRITAYYGLNLASVPVPNQNLLSSKVLFSRDVLKCGVERFSLGVIECPSEEPGKYFVRNDDDGVLHEALVQSPC